MRRAAAGDPAPRRRFAQLLGQLRRAKDRRVTLAALRAAARWRACWPAAAVGAAAGGASPAPPAAQLPLLIGQGAGGTSYSVPIQTLLFFTALCFLPAVLLLMTGFTRIVIVLEPAAPGARHAVGAAEPGDGRACRCSSPSS